MNRRGLWLTGKREIDVSRGGMRAEFRDDASLFKANRSSGTVNLSERVEFKSSLLELRLRREFTLRRGNTALPRVLFLNSRTLYQNSRFDRRSVTFKLLDTSIVATANRITQTFQSILIYLYHLYQSYRFSIQSLCIRVYFQT